MEPLAVVVGNARSVRQRPSKKTDRADAAWLAEFLAHGLVALERSPATYGASLAQSDPYTRGASAYAPPSAQSPPQGVRGTNRYQEHHRLKSRWGLPASPASSYLAHGTGCGSPLQRLAAAGARHASPNGVG
jgi:hypothetical protein